MDQMTRTPIQQNCRLLALPAELRDMVYHLVLTPGGDQHSQGHITFDGIKARTALLRVCSQTRNEATQMFYASSKFYIQDHFTEQAETRRFLKNAGRYAKLIPHLTVGVVLPRFSVRLLQAMYEVAGNASLQRMNELMEATQLVALAGQHSAEHIATDLVHAGVSSHNIKVPDIDVDMNSTPRDAGTAIDFLTKALGSVLVGKVQAVGAELEEGDGAEQQHCRDEDRLDAVEEEDINGTGPDGAEQTRLISVLWELCWTLMKLIWRERSMARQKVKSMGQMLFCRWERQISRKPFSATVR